jgi:hypothetical protein
LGKEKARRIRKVLLVARLKEKTRRIIKKVLLIVR